MAAKRFKLLIVDENLANNIAIKTQAWKLVAYVPGYKADAREIALEIANALADKVQHEGKRNG